MDTDYIASGSGAGAGAKERKLPIIGRPRQGQTQDVVILEEPIRSVLTHYIAGRGRVPHFREPFRCPFCELATEEPKEMWYLGAKLTFERFPAILELTPECYRGAEHYAAAENGLAFAGLRVQICRRDFSSSPRVLRCEFPRALEFPEWEFDTLRELMRTWGVVSPMRIHRAKEA